MRAGRITPLWPAGHLPLKGGDRLARRVLPSSDVAVRASVVSSIVSVAICADVAEWVERQTLLISPLEGEMAGRPEGGMTHFPVPKRNRTHAKSMRRVMTDAELKLWNEIRAHRLMGMSFRRQMPIAGHIVDFACPSHKIIVEIDGSQHGQGEHVASDRARDARLQALGWTILRFWNDDVLRDIDNICLHIVTVAGLARPEAGTALTDPTRPLRGHPPLKGEGDSETHP